MNRRVYMKTVLRILLILLVISIALPCTLHANKTAVTIQAPQEVKKGSEVTITLKVSHNGNNILHYTDWVVLKINGKVVKRWEFSLLNRPENENFSRSVTITANEPLKVEAQGNCNLHGSEGVATVNINVR
jgi:desulfoferrodoxin (superoxide reductase-like protein)